MYSYPYAMPIPKNMGITVSLVACKSHYSQAYLAFAHVAENYNQSGFGHDSVGFSTAFDGGFGNDGADEMWHVFANFVWDDWDLDCGRPATIEWIVAHKGRALKFEMPIEIRDHTGWPGVNFENLWTLLETKIEEWNSANVRKPHWEDVPQSEEVLTTRQRKFAERMELEYFTRWGQGVGDFVRCSREG